MSIKDTYIYPAVFTKEADGRYSVEFPDLPGCLTCGDNFEDALFMAKDALELHLYCMEDEGDVFPAPSEARSTSETESVVLVNVFMPPIRSEIRNQKIKKTLTISQWANDYGVRNNVNFSSILEQGLLMRAGMLQPDIICGNYIKVLTEKKTVTEKAHKMKKKRKEAQRYIEQL